MADKYLVLHINKNSLTPSEITTWNIDKIVEMYAYSSKKAKDIYLIYKYWSVQDCYTRIITIVKGVITRSTSDYVDLRELFEF